MQITKLSYNDSNYPDALRNIAAPPKELFIYGTIPDEPTVAIVGSRGATDYGKQLTYKIAGELAAAGVVIISGLARGIDAMAHQAAIDAGGKTIAVQACGMDRIYPASNRGLARDILRTGGAIMSEYPEGMPPLKQNFPARNRIISALSLAVLVTEGDKDSGALHTVKFGLEQGKTIFAIPGNITSPMSVTPNNLLKSGATPVTDTSDILVALDIKGLTRQPVKAKSKEEADLLELLGQGVNTSQGLIEQSGLSAAQFANVITLMEISGRVRNLGAGTWVSK